MHKEGVRGERNAFGLHHSCAHSMTYWDAKGTLPAFSSPGSCSKCRKTCSVVFLNAGRTAHSIAVHGDALYMFGGYGNNSYLGDAWSLVLPASQPTLQGHQDLPAAARISPAKDAGAAGSRLPTATVATAKPAVQTASRRNRRPAAAKAVKEEKAGYVVHFSLERVQFTLPSRAQLDCLSVFRMTFGQPV